MSNLVKQDKALVLPEKAEDFLALRKPIQCMVLYQKINTPLEAFKTKSTSLASLKKEYSDDWTRAYISLWIININEYLNVSRPMSEAQIEETAFFILSTYYYLKLSDITLIFNRAKKGEFGPMYESLDGTKILSWFEKYADERCNAIESDISKEDYKWKDIEKNDKRVSDTTDIKTAFRRAKGFELIERSKKQ